MSISIITKKAFSVIGISGEGDAANAVEWIQPLWAQAFEKRHEIQHRVKPEAWGLMSGCESFLSPWQEAGKYLAGWETTVETIDALGWDTWHVPDQCFATVKCTLGNYRETLELLVHTISRDQRYCQSGAIHEYYPAIFNNSDTDHLYLHMMIKEAAPRQG